MRFLWAAVGGLALANAASWDANNAPTLFSDSYEYNLAKLPASGSVKTLAWSETYWPSYESGIAVRWNAADPQNFKYHLYTKAELLQLQQAGNTAVLQSLSPAEKFDILNGRYDYPLVHEEWQRTHPNDASWEGICHGWAPASMDFAQPNPVTLTNADGIQVPFGSSDIKGLLSFYVGQFDTSAETKFIGQRCNSDLDADPSAANNPECVDLDAGAFHIVIANQLGLLQQGFVVDRDRGIQVWNQPVNSFETQLGTVDVPRANATAGAANSVVASTSMTYSKETQPQWQAHDPYQVTESYNYYLDLDSNGNIIGGSMMSVDRTDFAWSQSASPFFGYFTKLSDVYTASTNDANHPMVANMLTVSEDHLLARTHIDDHSESGTISLHNYANGAHRSWSIGKADDSCESQHNNFVTEIRFSLFDTERYHDQLSIYEGAKGHGPMVSVLHGTIPGTKLVKVQGPCALLVFKADHQNNHFGGFNAEWKIIPSSKF
jgi:hypothetical protein